MSATSTSLGAAAPARPTVKTARGLRRLRRLCLAVAVASAAVLPFERHLLQAPDLSVINLSGLPYVGRYFPQPRPVVHNSLRTVLVGGTEHFSARVPNLRRAPLTFVLQYANGRALYATVRTDAHGRAAHTFRITYRPHHFREIATILVYDAAGRLRAYTRFAVQLPGPPPRSR